MPETMKLKTCWMLALLAAPMLSHAETIAAPAIKAGDTWAYLNTLQTGADTTKQSHDSIVALRTDADHIYFEITTAGSPQPPIQSVAGANWSRSRQLNGTETVISEPLSFPLTAGKQWRVKYTEAQPNGQPVTRTYDTTLRVVGHEAVDVPAGHFDAIKIEGNGQWTNHTAQANGKPADVSGKLYKAFWYVPKINRWVKSVEQFDNPNGKHSQRMVSELESFQAGNGKVDATAAPAAPAKSKGKTPGASMI